MSMTVPALREALRRDGYRQVSYPSVGDPEFWWNARTRIAAEVALGRIFFYNHPYQRGYQEVATILDRGKVNMAGEVMKGKIPGPKVELGPTAPSSKALISNGADVAEKRAVSGPNSR